MSVGCAQCSAKRVRRVLRGRARCGYDVLANEVEERHVGSDDGRVRHHTWYVRVRGRLYYVSWLSDGPEGNGPECMAFLCDGHRDVVDWHERALSKSSSPVVAFAEVVEQLVCADGGTVLSDGGDGSEDGLLVASSSEPAE